MLIPASRTPLSRRSISTSSRARPRPNVPPGPRSSIAPYPSLVTTAPVRPRVVVVISFIAIPPSPSASPRPRSCHDRRRHRSISKGRRLTGQIGRLTLLRARRYLAMAPRPSLPRALTGSPPAAVPPWREGLVGQGVVGAYRSVLLAAVPSADSGGQVSPRSVAARGSCTPTTGIHPPVGPS